MKKNKENFIVRKLHDQYVGNNCAQVMLGYSDNMTVIGTDGILFHATEAENDSIDIFKYLEDDRRKEFPYHDTPTHYEGRFFKPSEFFVNQIFDYNKPYVVIRDKFVQQIYLKKGEKGVYSFFAAPTVSEPKITIEETSYPTNLLNILKRICEKNENGDSYIVDFDGCMINPFASEEEIRKNKLNFIMYLEKNNFCYEYNDKTGIFSYNNNEVKKIHIPDTFVSFDTTKRIITINDDNIDTKVVRLKKINDNTICTKLYDISFDEPQKLEEKVKVKSLKEPKVRR